MSKEVLSLSKWAFFVEAATTQQVLDMLKQSDLKVGSKYDKRYPGVIPAIIRFLEGFVDKEDPAKKYWREIVTMLKKDNSIKRRLDELQEDLWVAKQYRDDPENAEHQEFAD